MAAGDDPERVQSNRLAVQNALRLPGRPCWLNQVHSNRVVRASEIAADTEADGSVAFDANQVCVVMTADCLPVLLCDTAGTRVSALHAGWRGLANGVLEAGVNALQAGGAHHELIAWLGPAIGPAVYEVGDEVRAAFISECAQDSSAFAPSPAGRWFANLYELARRRLQAAGVGAVYGGDFCTFSEPDRFYSYRRDGRAGRMGTFIWLEPSQRD